MLNKKDTNSRFIAKEGDFDFVNEVVIVKISLGSNNTTLEMVIQIETDTGVVDGETIYLDPGQEAFGKTYIELLTFEGSTYEMLAA
jgi:hypothetical protein